MKPVHPVTDQLEPEPLDPERILFGNPKISSLTLAESKDGAHSGLWRCTPGVVAETEVEESFLVITGKGSLEFEDGNAIELEPGVTHRFTGGEKTKWTILETVLTAFVTVADPPPSSDSA